VSVSVIDLPWLREAPSDFGARCRAAGTAQEPAARELQFLAGYRLTSRNATLLARAVRRCRADLKDLAPLSPLRLGVLAGATSDLLLDDLVAAAARHGVALDIVSAPYDQVAQQAFDPTSLINAARPDAILVAVDHRWLRLDRPVLDQDAAQNVAARVGQLREIVQALRTHSGAAAILQTVATPPTPLFGSLDRRVQGSVRAMIDEANRAIGELAEQAGTYLLDVAALAEHIGTDRWFDPVQWAAYKLPFSADCVPIYADHAGRLLGAIRGKTRFAGGPDPEGAGFASNITPAAIGTWSEADIATTLTTGRTPELRYVGSSMANVVANLAMLPQSDRDAIASYVKSLPPRPTPPP